MCGSHGVLSSKTFLEPSGSYDPYYPTRRKIWTIPVSMSLNPACIDEFSLIPLNIVIFLVEVYYCIMYWMFKWQLIMLKRQTRKRSWCNSIYERYIIMSVGNLSHEWCLMSCNSWWYCGVSSSDLMMTTRDKLSLMTWLMVMLLHASKQYASLEQT